MVDTELEEGMAYEEICKYLTLCFYRPPLYSFVEDNDLFYKWYNRGGELRERPDFSLSHSDFQHFNDDEKLWDMNYFELVNYFVETHGYSEKVVVNAIDNYGSPGETNILQQQVANPLNLPL